MERHGERAKGVVDIPRGELMPRAAFKFAFIGLQFGPLAFLGRLRVFRGLHCLEGPLGVIARDFLTVGALLGEIVFALRDLFLGRQAEHCSHLPAVHAAGPHKHALGYERGQDLRIIRACAFLFELVKTDAPRRAHGFDYHVSYGALLSLDGLTCERG